MPENLFKWKQVIQSLDINKVKDFGSYMMCTCPFPEHEDAGNPSCGVYHEEGRYYCFGCKKRGSLIEFTQAALGGVTIYVAQRYASQFMQGLDLEGEIKAKKQPTNPVPIPVSYLDSFSVSYEYLLSRGISKETQELFGIKHDKRRNELIFPVFDAEGKLIFTKNRRLNPESVEEWGKFGYWPVGAKQFHRGSVFRIDLVKPKNHVVVLVEGEIDAMYLWECGMNYVVSVFGSSPNKEQIMGLRNKGANIVVAMFDQDAAGELAWERLKEEAKGTGVSLKKIDYNTNDPAELSLEKVKQIERGIFE